MANLQGWVTAILLASICVIGMLTAAGSLALSYSGKDIINPNHEATFNVVSQMTDISEQMTDDLKGLQTGNVADILGAVLRGGWGVIKLILNTPILLHAMIIDIGKIIGLPAYFVNTILVLMLFTLGILMAGALMRYKLGGRD